MCNLLWEMGGKGRREEGVERSIYESICIGLSATFLVGVEGDMYDMLL